MAGAWGAFGKIPTMGDFLRVDVPAGFVEAWDTWLQGCMLSARRDLGARWQECYFSAPIWRFTLSQGLAGKLPVIGVLVPSVDRVGRHFPLTLMAPLTQGAPVILTHLTADATFTRLEELALEVLERDIDRTQLAHRMAALPRMSPPRAAVMASAGPGLTMIAPPHRAAGADLASALLDARLRQPTLWSSLLADGTRLMVAEGLPRDTQTTGLFDLSAPVWSGAARS